MLQTSARKRLIQSCPNHAHQQLTKSKKSIQYPKSFSINYPPLYTQNGEKDLNHQYLLNIGEGSFGSVFLILSLETKKKLVLKCIKKDPEESLFEQKYESEIQALKTMRDLQAKYIIEISSIQFHSPEYHIFAMEYMNQESLIQYLTKVWPLSRDLNRNIVKQVLLAIKEIHDGNIAHFDVKLDNYLVHEEDGQISVKLADFDTCRILSGTEIEMIPHPENFIGTPEYGAPEMRVTAEVYPTINPKAVDVYSCGISIYLLFTGDKTKNPYTGFEGVFADYGGGGDSEMDQEMESFDLQDMVDHMTRLNFQGNDEKRLTINQVLEMPYAKLCILN